LITFSTVRPSRPPRFALFPYTTLFRSHRDADGTLLAVAPNAHLGNLPRSRVGHERGERGGLVHCLAVPGEDHVAGLDAGARGGRSEEHTSELQSRFDLVCRLLLEKKKE